MRQAAEHCGKEQMKMSSKNDFKTMLEHVESGDFEEIRDVLTMMSEELDRQEKKVKALEKKMRRVNQMFPNTAEVKR